MDEQIEKSIQERIDESVKQDSKKEHEVMLLLKCFATWKRLPEWTVDTVSIERAFRLIKEILSLDK